MNATAGWALCAHVSPAAHPARYELNKSLRARFRRNTKARRPGDELRKLRYSGATAFQLRKQEKAWVWPSRRD
jgi:hypothetical protein